MIRGSTVNLNAKFVCQVYDSHIRYIFNYFIFKMEIFILIFMFFFIQMEGNPDKGVMYIPKDILSVIRSQSWMTVRMKTRIFCGIVLLLAALSQRRLPYHAGHAEIMGNDYLFFGDSSYVHELTSLTEVILQNLVDMIEQEPSRVVRGSTALEACNCIATALKTNHNVSLICSKLIETAKLCLNTKDKYLQCTIKFLDRMSASSVGTRPLIL